LVTFLIYTTDVIQCSEYSGAIFDPVENNTGPSPRSRMRPDTPEPDFDANSVGDMFDAADPNAISVEEMNAQLLETARQESLRDCMAQIAANELANNMVIDEDEGPRASTLRSHPASPPPIEYNRHGQLSAKSKGKGRAD
jgi:hypothetical protein